ncbi:hypothetical protein KUTeg_000496 [Tegillarca granosa]|uniref:PKD/Chitinase domain-containing protein n=1 Tax=Tegillarca granosa TaxID=220873 RepID=A0ABQ9FXS2_TEGGR|nr:hypothetical protein KUTeg_000496 [Tegillarca granosa]
MKNSSVTFLFNCFNYFWIIIAVATVVCLNSGVLSVDICQKPTNKEAVFNAVHYHSVPFGRLQAGVYTKNNTAKKLSDCSYSCCLNKSCNSVFYHNKTCYLIQCNASWVGSCDPHSTDDPKFADTIYVTVRNVDYGSAKNVGSLCDLDTGEGCLDTQDCKASHDNGQYRTVCVCKDGLCIFGLLAQCDVHEECYLPEQSRTKVGKCICEPNYIRDDTGTCVLGSSEDILTSTPKQSTQGQEIRTCEFGILPHCNENEECFIPKHSKKKYGICVCKDSYRKNSATEPVYISSSERSSKIPTTTTTTPAVTELTVGASDKEIQLPVNTVTLNAYVIEKEKAGEKFEYQWSLITSPDGSEGGKMEGKNTDKLKLSDLIAGLYTFKIKVTGNKRSGEAFANVTVIPAARKNMPPVAVIKPTHQEVKLPNTPILDGSASTDDDKIVSYHWQEVSGPLQDQKIDQDTAMLTLKDLAPDSDGATNSTLGNVTVIKETDYPPKANAGSDVIIHLPQKTVTLYGNLSTDDKGIKSYEWIKAADDKLTADMQGVRSPVLKLSNLQLGDYTFTLKVTDTADQVSTANVHVFVKPDVNHPPNAVTAGKVTEYLPLKSLVLDGLYDLEKIHSVAQLLIEVKEKANKPPVANAGGDKSITLPLGVATLDGSKSTDDKGIVRYSWNRDPSSLAAGEVINGSDHQAVLQLVNLVSGQYIFSLTVVDSEGLSSTDSASLIINIQNQLSLILPKSPDGDTVIKILHTDTNEPGGRVKLIFYVVNQMKETQTIRNGLETLNILKEKIHSSGYHILNYHVISLDTVVCQNNCSGHGVCDIKTKRCICEAFWMENIFTSYFTDGESNCAGIVWGLICWCKKKRCKCKWKTKKRHRYSLLQEVDYKDEMELLPKETLFVNHKKPNGFLQKPPNGISKQHLKTKLRT